MFFLAGLLGMMMLGSFAVVSTADGAEGEDIASADGADDSADGSDGTASGSLFERLGLIDPVEAADSSEAVMDDPQGLTVEGGDGSDTITGTDYTDFLGGAGGDDLIDGAGADDDLHGGSGTDTLLGDAGNDTVHGEADSDEIHGGADADSLFGHDGDDQIYGGAGNDVGWGGLGSDELHGDDGADALHGREGDDTLVGGAGQDTLFGGWQNDLLDGRSGEETPETDYLNGGDGADVLVLGPGDIATGGEDEDTFVAGDWLTVDAATLTDFDATEDQLVIVYDDANDGAEPSLDMRMSDDDPTVTDVFVDGALVLSMPTIDVPVPDAIALVAQSDAVSLGMM